MIPKEIKYYNTVPIGYDLKHVGLENMEEDFRAATEEFLQKCLDIKNGPIKPNKHKKNPKIPDKYDKEFIFPTEDSTVSAFEKWDTENSHTKMKMAGLYHRNKTLKHPLEIFTNLDKDMSFSCDPENKNGIIPQETIHAETNLIGNVDKSRILDDNLWFFILARPCVPCSKSIVSFHKTIQRKGGKGIEYIFVLKDDLYPHSKNTNDQLQTDFQIVLGNLLDAGIIVIVYELTIEGIIYNGNSLAKSIYNMFLEYSRNTTSGIDIKFTKLDYEHISLIEKANTRLEKNLSKKNEELKKPILITEEKL